MPYVIGDETTKEMGVGPRRRDRRPQYAELARSFNGGRAHGGHDGGRDGDHGDGRQCSS